MSENILKVAHRGHTKVAPENTIAAVEAAIAAGADAIEVDVRTCKTGEAIVIHDHSVNRTTNGQGDVSQLTLEQIKQLDAGNGQKIPTLPEVLKAVNQRCIVFIDIKHVSAAKPAADIVSYFVKNDVWTYGKLPIISLLHQSIVMAREQAPQITTGASLKTLPESLAAVGEFTNSRYLLPDCDILTGPLVVDAHKRGLRVVTWNCNTPEQVAKAKGLLVDGIICDDINSL